MKVANSKEKKRFNDHDKTFFLPEKGYVQPEKGTFMAFYHKGFAKDLAFSIQSNLQKGNMHDVNFLSEINTKLSDYGPNRDKA